LLLPPRFGDRFVREFFALFPKLSGCFRQAEVTVVINQRVAVGATTDLYPRSTNMPTKKNATKKPAVKKTKDAKPKQLSAIDAAVKVLGESKEPLNTKAMIEAMSAKGYWKSPGGKTPHATLYSAILREINEKGKEARFKKTERGRFALA
jgi:hypothetical protein